MDVPRVGDLVKLDDLAVSERGYFGNPDAGQVGVIIKCVGIRCHVQWTSGEITRPERTVLEIINHASR